MLYLVYIRSDSNFKVVKAPETFEEACEIHLEIENSLPDNSNEKVHLKTFISSDELVDFILANISKN